MIKKGLIVAIALIATLQVFGQGTNGSSKAESIRVYSGNIQDISREVRQQAYMKLLEGQRFLWKLKYSKNTTESNEYAELAEKALLTAVRLDPMLAEGFTALTEVSLLRPGGLVASAIAYANDAVAIDPNSLVAHRYLAMLYTSRSGIDKEKVDPISTKIAIEEWNEVVRLDPQNAEGWAFLSLFYQNSNDLKKEIEALEKWVSSTPPVDYQFYAAISKGGSLDPEAALPRLGEAFIEAGNYKGALGVLTRAVADDPENEEAVSLLSRVIGSVDNEELKAAVEALRQAAFANPTDAELVNLLGKTLARSGDPDGAVSFLQSSVAKFGESNKLSASSFQMTIGDIFAQNNKTDEAINAYRKALEIRGVSTKEKVSDDDRDFTITVVNRMVDTLKRANRTNEAEKLLNEIKSLVGKQSLEIEKRLIDLEIGRGNFTEALARVQEVRTESPFEVGLVRREAIILVSLGKVDEGVKIISALIGTKGGKVPSMLNDDFSNYLFLASLYTSAGMEKPALNSLEGALKSAKNKESVHLAKLNLASTQQTFGNYKDAEKNLRVVLNDAPRYPMALNNLGYLLAKQNRNLDEAAQLIRKAISIEPDNASFLDSLGWVYFKQGNYDDAEKYLKLASNLNSTSAVILDHLGDLYNKKGEDALARSSWERALALSNQRELTISISSKLSH
ncbi:MAG: tetratricopeptide repeat protein [Pyrinomonadaceae bacterium]